MFILGIGLLRQPLTAKMGSNERNVKKRQKQLIGPVFFLIRNVQCFFETEKYFLSRVFPLVVRINLKPNNPNYILSLFVI